MPNPTSEDRVSQVLTNISTAYRQAQTAYIASKVFPVVPVMKQTDKYYTWPKADWFRDTLQRRADAEESAGGGMRLSSDSYLCDVWALHKDIGSQARANLQNEVQLDRATTIWLTQQALIREEIQWTADYFVTGVWGTSTTPANLWDDYTTSDPMTDIETGKKTILQNTGMQANTLVLGYDVFTKLKHHPDVVDRFKYTQADVVTSQMLARLFEVDNLYVCMAVKNTADEALAATMAFVQGKHALLCHVASEPGLMIPSAGYLFSWVGDENNVSQGLGETVGVRTFYIQERKADRYEIEVAFDDKLVASDLGYMFVSAVA